MPFATATRRNASLLTEPNPRSSRRVRMRTCIDVRRGSPARVYSGVMQLHVCVQCRRHVDVNERTCPFCRAELAIPAPRVALPVARLSRATVFAGAALAGACWTSSAPRTTTVEDKTHERVEEPTPKPVAPGTIRGVLRDLTTRAVLANTPVTLHTDDGMQRRSVTDDRGEYVFTDLPPGTYIIAYDPMHPRQSPTLIQVTLADGVGQRADLEVYVPSSDPGPCCKPYGAPPARRRVV